MKKILPPLFFMMVAAGCQSEYSRNKGLFLFNCMRGIATEKVCRCIFHELEKKYTIDDFKRLNARQGTPQFRESIADATVTCSLR